MENVSYNYKLIRQLINKNAAKLHTLEFILSELANRTMTRMDYIKIQPLLIANYGIWLGLDSKLLQDKFPKSKVVEIDAHIELIKQQYQRPNIIKKLFTPSPVRNFINAHGYNLPLVSQSCDFFYSNQALPLISDVVKFLKEVRRVLKVGGSFCVAGLGVDSFKELRELGLATFRFPDMHDVGDMLIEVGFSNPVVDTEYITLEYDNLQTVLQDIRVVGCGAANFKDLRKELTKEQYNAIQSKLEQPCKITLEIFVAHGWKDQQKIDLPEGYSPISFSKK